MRIDWAAFIPDGLQAVEDGDKLRITNIRSEIVIQRFTSVDETSWFLGVYLAEGAKEGCGCSVPNTNPLLIKRVENFFLDDLKLSLHELQLEISYGPRDTIHTATQRFKNLRSPLARVRFREDKRGKGNSKPAAVIIVRNGLTLKRTLDVACRFFISGINDIPKEAIKAFLVGFLDGDGSVTYATPLRLGFYDDSREVVEAIAHGLDRIIGWDPERVSYKQRGRLWSGYRWLHGPDAVKLAKIGVFNSSINRARLLKFCVETLQPYRQLLACGQGPYTQEQVKTCFGQFNGCIRYGYLKHNNGRIEISDLFLSAITDNTLDAEMAFVSRRYPTREAVVTRERGIPYQYDPIEQKTVNSDL